MAPLLRGHGLHLDGDRTASVVTPPQWAASIAVGKPLHTLSLVSEYDRAKPVYLREDVAIPDAVTIAPRDNSRAMTGI
jgi:hypothetical protein